MACLSSLLASDKTKDDEERQQLHVSENGDLYENPMPSTRRPISRVVTWTRIHILALYVAIITLASLLGCIKWKDVRIQIPPISGATSWSPVQNLVEYELSGANALDHHTYSKFSGPPTPEQEKAWNDLIRPVYFRATREELEKGGETVDNLVELTDGKGGYLATIGVYHELHCLRQLRLQLYRGRYYPNLTEAQDKYIHGHLDHCLEALRLTIMCHGNTGLYSFAWDDPTAFQPTTKSNAKSVCVKWDPIESWSYSRMVSSNPPISRPFRSNVKEP